MKRSIIIPREEEARLIASLRDRTDIEAERILRYYAMPDLSRTAENPIAGIVEKIRSLPRYRDFDVLETPEVVGVTETFDLFGFAADHPARSQSDTYYVTNDRILRTHTTVAWHYALKDPEVRSELERNGKISLLSHGKVYRKDEIDRKHMNVFHQIDGFSVYEKSQGRADRETLVNILVELTKGLFWDGIEYRVLDDSFPYTDPSAQIEIKVGDDWMEILGSGIIKGEILRNLGVDPERYHGWAFGPGIERLAMIAKKIPDIRLLWSQDPRVVRQWKDLETPYAEVSKYPATVRDISFVLDKKTSLNDYYGLIGDVAGDLVEEVVLLDRYENDQKFGAERVSYTWRIVYRSLERTLENDEINALQSEIRSRTQSRLNAELR